MHSIEWASKKPRRFGTTSCSSTRRRPVATWIWDWHRQMDAVMLKFINRQGSNLTTESLLEFIHNYYQNSVVSSRIPFVNLMWGF